MMLGVLTVASIGQARTLRFLNVGIRVRDSKVGGVAADLPGGKIHQLIDTAKQLPLDLAGRYLQK